MEVETWRPRPDCRFSTGSKRNAMPAGEELALAELIAPSRFKIALVLSAGGGRRGGDVAPRQHGLRRRVAKNAPVGTWNRDAIWAWVAVAQASCLCRIAQVGSMYYGLTGKSCRTPIWAWVAARSTIIVVCI